MFDKLRAYLFIDPLVILATIVMGSVNLVVSLWDKGGDQQLQIARAWARMLCGFAGVRLTLQGKQHIAPGEQYILCVNHLSYMDTPVVLGHIPLNFRFMARKQLFDVPFMGWHLQRAGHLPVDQESPREAIRTLNDAARLIRERRISVLVFPEGGRARDGQLQEFKEGAFLLAIKSGIPILPVGLRGTYEMLPMGSGVIRPGPVRMRIGAPIPTQGLRDRGALSNQVRAAIQELTRA